MPKIKITKKSLILLLIVAFAIIASLGLYLKQSSENDKPVSQPVAPQETINYGPATNEEKQQAVDNKQKNDELYEKLQTGDKPSSQNKKQVKPTITNAGLYGDNIEISVFVDGIFEDGGKCTAYLRKDGLIVTRQTIGVKEGRATYCPLLSVGKSSLTRQGNWSVTVEYSSDIAAGTSDPVNLDVQ